MVDLGQTMRNLVLKPLKTLCHNAYSHQKLAAYWLTIRDSHPLSHMTFWSRGLPRSRYKLKPLYLYYYSVCGHQTRHDGDLPWKSPRYKVTWTFDYVTWSFEILWKIKAIISSLSQCLYRHQNWQDGDLPWGTPTNNITWPINHMALWGHVTT